MAEERCRGNGEGPWISSKFLQSSANTMRQRRREFEVGLICTRGEIDLFLCRPSKADKRSSNQKSLTTQKNQGIFPKQKHTGLNLIITNRSCVLDTENKNKKPVKSTPEGHGHSLKKIVFFRPNEPAWKIFHAGQAFHAEPGRCLKIKYDVFDYGEFNCELYLLIH